MLGDFILGLPILCLLVSILYCGVCLWKAYQESIHLRAHRIIESIGFWKTGMGRWRSLALSSCLYFVSTILSIVVSVLSYFNLLKFENFVFTWTRDLKEYITTILFAGITMILSLAMYGIDFSKLTKRLSYFLEIILIIILPVIGWMILGVGTYKDFFSKDIFEWFSSTGGVFQLFWGIVSLLVMVITVYRSYQDLWMYNDRSI